MKDKIAAIKALGNLSVNLSAGWLSVVFIAPGFITISSIKDVLTLISDIFFGILFLFISYKLEKTLL